MSLAEQNEEETPGLADLILMAIRANQVELNTCMPATIVSYDSAKQTASVQPSFKRMRLDTKSFITRAVIDDVPVVFPRSQGRGIVFPIAAGDPVMLLFSQRSLDSWLDKGGEIDLADTRLHNINDAIAVPGLTSINDALSPTPSSTALEVRSDKLFIGDPDGAGAPLSGLTKSDVVQALAKTIEQILSQPLVSAMGPVNFAPSVISALQEIQTMIEGFE